MAGAKEISDELEKCKLFHFEDEALSVENKYVLDCLNNLDDNETNVDKIAKHAHEFLLASSIKDAKKVIDKCQEDGKTFYTQSQKKKKTAELTIIFYDEKLKMLKQHLFKDE